MSLKYVQYNDTTGAMTADQAPVGPTIEDYDSASGGQSLFPTVKPFDANTVIRALVGGIKMREGSGKDYVRNVALQLISFNNTVAEGTWVSIEIY